MTTVLVQTITTPKGITIERGTPVICRHHAFNRLSFTTPDDITLSMGYRNAFMYLSGFVEINDAMLKEPLHSGLSYSPTGEKVEIDGYDKYGFPSIHRLLLLV
jgi:hypothetical protein